MSIKMKNYFKQTLTVIGIISIVILGIIQYNNDYLNYKDRRCVVLDKIQSVGYRGSENFYLILKEEREIVFDIIVNPSTFSQSKIGNIKYFNLRDFDIRQTPMNNVLYFFTPILLLGVSLFGLIGGFILYKI